MCGDARFWDTSDAEADTYPDLHCECRPSPTVARRCGNYLVLRCESCVITLIRARDEAGLCDLDFYAVVFILPVGCGRGERELVVGRDVGDALLQERGEIVVKVESQTAALNGEHL